MIYNGSSKKRLRKWKKLFNKLCEKKKALEIKVVKGKNSFTICVEEKTLEIILGKEKNDGNYECSFFEPFTKKQNFRLVQFESTCRQQK